MLHVFCTPALAQETIYQSFEVDSAAQPRGGIAYLNAFLQTNLRKPVGAEAKGIGGRIIVSAIVETDGHVTAVKAAQNKFPELNREAERVFSLFNAWQPAQKAAKAVRQQVSIPVMFAPNAPFTYADGARISYFDANQKSVVEGSDQIRYKQVSPVDTNGLPTGDIVVYRAKGTNWKEEYRLPFVRSKRATRSPWGKPVYEVGHRNGDKQWQGTVFSVDDTGALVSQTDYENGRTRSSSVNYHANGLVAERSEDIDGRKTLTSWIQTDRFNKSGGSAIYL